MVPQQGQNQRKQPHQERARATVERIVEASGRVLAQNGYDGCSTNRIATEAGVSKGSLYQYFADKDEILTALARSIADGLMHDVGTAIDGYLGVDIWTLGAGVLTATFDAVEGRRDVLRPLLLEAPHIDVIDMTSAVVVRAHDIGRTYIALNPDQFPDGIDSDATIFVLFSALRATLVSYVTGTTDLSRDRLTAALASVFVPALTR